MVYHIVKKHCISSLFIARQIHGTFFKSHITIGSFVEVEQTELCQIFHSTYNISLYTTFCMIVFVPKSP